MAELITNGSFSGDGSPWNFTDSWELISNSANIPGGGEGNLNQEVSGMLDATLYLVSFTINVPALNFEGTGPAEGSISVQVGNNDSGRLVSLGDYAGLGTVTVNFFRTSDTGGEVPPSFFFEANLIDVLDGSYVVIDNVSLDSAGTTTSTSTVSSSTSSSSSTSMSSSSISTTSSVTTQYYPPVKVSKLTLDAKVDKIKPIISVQ